MSERELIISLSGIFAVFVLPVIVWLIFRMFAHRERMAMIARGIHPNGPAPSEESRWATFGQPMRPGEMLDPVQAQYAMRRSIMLAAVGLAITIGLSFLGYGPWLILGMIPLFIGVAQLMIATLGNSGMQPRMGAPYAAAPPPAPPPPQPPSGPSTAYESSYAYRPAPQEPSPPALEPGSDR